MKKIRATVWRLGLFMLPVLLTRTLFAQGYGGPLIFQGLDQYTLHSAAGRAMAGVSMGGSQDPGLMFQNPASLHAIDRAQLSLGGSYLTSDMKQEQQYAPVRYYPNLSLLLEGLTATIPDPDTSLFGFTAQDTLQRPFDDIQPNWSRSKRHETPLQALLAVPLSFKSMKIVLGVGAVEYANLDHYYQNNNVLSPGILSQRPLPTFRPTDDNPVVVEWSQSVRSREGSIQGYGVALAADFPKYNLSVGFSGMILDGSSNDYEQEIARGRLTFFSNAFRADSVFSRITRTGTSDFSGQEFTISSILRGRYVSAGFSVKLPNTITRKYIASVDFDPPIITESPVTSHEDKMKLPLRGSLGLSLTPKEKITVGLEYEFRRSGSAEYVDSQGNKTSPWLSAALYRLGVEYRAARWLSMRGGLRGAAETFQPEGNQITGEPVTYTVYSAGFGVFFSGLGLNVTYENSLMKYQDIWASAISKNRERNHIIVGQITYEIPWSR